MATQHDLPSSARRAVPRMILSILCGLCVFPAVARCDEPDSIDERRSYRCFRRSGPIAIDGKLDDAAWREIPWTSDFVDIEGSKRPLPRFRTRAKMTWDEAHLYIAAELEEPHVWGTLTMHDAVIFHDNDFELFLDPDGDRNQYGEFEMNALNTGWDLFLPKPYRDGGQADNSWEIEGLQTAVFVDGTLNDSSDKDQGWTLEIAIPFAALPRVTGSALPPQNQDRWRINFSRVEWTTDVVDGKYKKVEGKREDNWVWSPQGLIDMHLPEKWGVLEFSTSAASDEPN